MALQVTRNSVIQASAGPSDQLLYYNHVPFTHDPGGTWKRYDAVTNTWLPAADPQTGPVAVPGAPLSLAMSTAAPISASSASVTFAPPSAGGIVDFGGYVTQYKRNIDATWTNGQTVQRITPGRGSITFAGNTWEVRTDARIYQNGALDAVTNGVLELLLINGQFWQQNNVNAWYWKLLPGDNWTGPIATSPLASPGPLVSSALVATTLYNFRVHAFNSVGAGVNTAPVNGTTTAPASSFTTQGASIRDPSGNLWTFKGVGIWEGYGSPAWFKPMEHISWKHMIDACKSLGFNCIRMGMSMTSVLNPSSTPLQGNMTSAPNNADLAGNNLMEFYDKVIDYCGSIGGIYFLADMHNTTGGMSTGFTTDGQFTLPGNHVAGNSGWSKDGYTDIDYINAWKAVATRWAGKPAWAACDMMNEPFSNQTSWLGDGSHISLGNLYARAANAIHAEIIRINPSYPLPLIVCQISNPGSPSVGGDFRSIASNLLVLNNANKVCYSPHNYPAPWLPGGVSDSGNAAMDWYNNTWGYIVANNLAPVWLTEWGGTDTGTFSNAAAYWNTLRPYLMGTAAYTSPNGTASPTKRTHWQVWDFAITVTEDVVGIMDAMTYPPGQFTNNAGCRGHLNALIAAAPT